MAMRPHRLRRRVDLGKKIERPRSDLYTFQGLASADLARLRQLGELCGAKIPKPETHIGAFDDDLIRALLIANILLKQARTGSTHPARKKKLDGVGRSLNARAEDLDRYGARELVGGEDEPIGGTQNRIPSFDELFNASPEVAEGPEDRDYTEAELNSMRYADLIAVGRRLGARSRTRLALTTDILELQALRADPVTDTGADEDALTLEDLRRYNREELEMLVELNDGLFLGPDYVDLRSYPQTVLGTSALRARITEIIFPDDDEPPQEPRLTERDLANLIGGDLYNMATSRGVPMPLAALVPEYRERRRRVIRAILNAQDGRAWGTLYQESELRRAEVGQLRSICRQMGITEPRGFGQEVQRMMIRMIIERQEQTPDDPSSD